MGYLRCSNACGCERAERQVDETEWYVLVCWTVIAGRQTKNSGSNRRTGGVKQARRSTEIAAAPYHFPVR